MSLTTLNTQPGSGSGSYTARTSTAAGDAYRHTAAIDAQIQHMTNEQLVKHSEQLQGAISWLQLETDVFAKFLQRVDPWESAAGDGADSSRQQQGGSSVTGSLATTSPSASSSDLSASEQSRLSSAAARTAARIKRGSRRSTQRGSGGGGVGPRPGTVRLTPEQKCDIASRELEELTEKLIQQEALHEKNLRSLRSLLDAAEIRLKEIHLIKVNFEKDVMRGAPNVRTTRVATEKVQRHFDDLNKTRDALLEKLRLKNANMKSKTRKLQAHMRQKEEMGEVLRQVDFDQLKIENQQHMTRIDERNNTMIQLKMLAGRTLHELNQQKRKLQALTEQGQQLEAAIGRELNIGRRVAAERAVVEAQLDDSRDANDKLCTQMDNYRVPPTMDYIRCNDRVYQLKRQSVIWRRKLDISRMTLHNLCAAHGIKQTPSQMFAAEASASHSDELDQASESEGGVATEETVNQKTSASSVRRQSEASGQELERRGSELSVVSSKAPVVVSKNSTGSRASLHQ